MKKIAVFAVLAASFAVSCGKEAEEIRFDEGLTPVCVETGIGSFGYDIRTRSGMDSMIEQGFGLIGFNTGGGTFNPEEPSGLVFDNYMMTSSDGVNWNYAEDIAYWNAASTDKYTFLAYHPYNSAQSSVSLDVPVGEKINDCKDYLAAEPVVNRTTRGSVKLAFKHIFPKINTEIVLTDAYKGHAYTLREIKFSGIQEYETFSLATNDFDRDNVVSHNIVSETVNIKKPTLETTEDKITIDPIYISPYPYATEGKNITVSFSFDYSIDGGTGTVKSFTKDILLSNDFERNHEYNLKVMFAPDVDGDVAMEVTVGDYSETVDLDLPIGMPLSHALSRNGSANSYIVTEKGLYTFDATYKGNSNTEEVGDIASVKVLWESYGTAEALEEGSLIYDLGFDRGTVSFTASGKKGNALIAAFDGPDGTGDILWSWHIWLTDMPVEQVYNNGAGISLDRNLGATSALKEDGVKTYGLLYQWGRKDPFLNVGTPDGEGEAVNTGTWPEPVEGRQSPEWADANPMTYVGVQPAGGYDNYAWIDVFDNYRWITQDGGKTVNDPCPPGYMVPSGNNNESFYSIASNDFSGECSAFDGGVDFGRSDSGICFTSDELCWYPVTGFRAVVNQCKLTKDRYGACWLGETDGTWHSYMLHIFDATTIRITKHVAACAYSVRCVKE